VAFGYEIVETTKAQQSPVKAGTGMASDCHAGN
jgi:hypothetical protein